ncbi:MAG: porin family protein [Desulfobacterales bacterium]|nr:porin family protein [Desulfobacterales bacterium]
MNKYFMFMIVTVALIGLTSIASVAETPSAYFAVKGGLYSPSKSYDLDNFNSGNKTHLDSKTGLYWDIVIGYYLLPIFAMELNAGYFESKGSPSAIPGELKLKVIPVVANAKVLLPLGPIEPYGEFGIGAYFTNFDIDGHFSKLSDSSDSSDVTYGLHAGVGINFNITDNLFLGIDGRYLWAKPSYGGVDIALDGFIVTAALGIRY